jgi:hypothetical protein
MQNILSALLSSHRSKGSRDHILRTFELLHKANLISSIIPTTKEQKILFRDLKREFKELEKRRKKEPVQM